MFLVLIDPHQKRLHQLSKHSNKWNFKGLRRRLLLAPNSPRRNTTTTLASREPQNFRPQNWSTNGQALSSRTAANAVKASDWWTTTETRPVATRLTAMDTGFVVPNAPTAHAWQIAERMRRRSSPNRWASLTRRHLEHPAQFVGEQTNLWYLITVTKTTSSGVICVTHVTAVWGYLVMILKV